MATLCNGSGCVFKDSKFWLRKEQKILSLWSQVWNVSEKVERCELSEGQPRLACKQIFMCKFKKAGELHCNVSDIKIKCNFKYPKQKIRIIMFCCFCSRWSHEDSLKFYYVWIFFQISWSIRQSKHIYISSMQEGKDGKPHSWFSPSLWNRISN